MTASEQVLQWIEAYIEDNRLRVGDALPREHDIMAETGMGRSSVREALTALKVLGIIQSRRKGGITIIRDPVMLEMRHYFSDKYDESSRYEEVLEFRAAMEWGLGPLMLSCVKKPTILALRDVLKTIEQKPGNADEITSAEIKFHRILTAGCGNRLAGLFVHLYDPIFRARSPAISESAKRPGYAREWLAQHKALVDSLEAGDDALFLAYLQKHTHAYMHGLSA